MQTKEIDGGSRDDGVAPGAEAESPPGVETAISHELPQRILRLEGDLKVRDREEQAARRLVRDWRNVDDVTDVRDLLGDNLPTILRPALLTALEEIENIVHHWFRRAEREIQRL